MEKSQCDSHRSGGGSHLGLCRCLQRLQECPNGGALQPLQAGLGLGFGDVAKHSPMVTSLI